MFVGDTLFLGGCGRFFEGTPTQMYNALCNILGKMPSATVSFISNFNFTKVNALVTVLFIIDQRVYFGHEYSVSNLIFAEHVEPDNPDIKKKLNWVKVDFFLFGTLYIIVSLIFCEFTYTQI